MDKKSILSELRHCQVHSIELGDYSAFTDKGLEQFAKTIAQAHEEEVADYRATIEELERGDVIQGFAQREDIHQTRLAESQAQVAVMAEALRLHDEFRDATYDSGYYAANKGSGDKLLIDAIARRNALTKRMRAALQSAPTVLARRTGAYWPEDDTLVMIEGTDIDIGQLVDEDRRLVDILILEGTDALQEQSKAQEPDEECSVAGKQGHKSEQEE